MLRLCVLSGLCLLALACDAPRVEAPLLEIEAVEPAIWAPGTRVAVSAIGLPIGREGELRLDGTIHRPGEADLHVDLPLTVRATAAGRAEAVVDHVWLAELGGRGTFEGTLTLRFHGETQASIYGRWEEARFDVEPAPLSTAFRDDPEPAIATLGAFGAHLRPPADPAADGSGGPSGDGAGEAGEGDEPESPGLLTAVTGPAADSGLRPGDRLVAVGGVSVRSWSDLRVDPNAAELAVRFRRDGLRGEREVVLTGPPEAGSAAEAPLLPWVVAALLLALFGAPLRSVRRHFHTLRRHWSRNGRETLGAALYSALGATVILALWPLGPAARAALVLAAGLVAGPRAIDAWRHLPAAALVAAAPYLVGTGALAPASWPVLRAPQLLPLLLAALLPLLRIEGARWRRAPRVVALAALAAAITAEPSASLAAAVPFAVAMLAAAAVVPDRSSPRAHAAIALAAAGLSLGGLVLAHVHLELPPARASWGAMAPAFGAALLVLVAALASARARVRAPFGL